MGPWEILGYGVAVTVAFWLFVKLMENLAG